MPLDSLIALAILMLAMFWTPGPNNALLALSGVKHGLRKRIHGRSVAPARRQRKMVQKLRENGILGQAFLPIMRTSQLGC